MKKEGARGVRGLVPKILLANLGDFLKNLSRKGEGVRPPYGSTPVAGCIHASFIYDKLLKPYTYCAPDVYQAAS